MAFPLKGPSGFFTAVNPGATGNGGTLTIETGSLRVAEGAQIVSATGGSGNAGSLIVQADTIELTGVAPQNLGASGLLANAIISTGAGGNVKVTSNKLIVNNGATISVSNFSSRNPLILPGQGAAGNIEINSPFIEIDNQGSLTAETATGDEGNITLNSSDLRLRRGGRISTNALGSSSGGNIMIKTDTLVAFENSDITANALQGFGGRVSISAKAIFGTEFRTQLTSESDITATSQLGPAFSGTVEITSPEVDPASGLVELSSEVVDLTGLIAKGCPADEGNFFVVTGRGGLPEVPNQTLRGRSVWRDLRPLGQNMVREETESKVVSSYGRETQSPVIQVQGWIIDDNGKIILTSNTSSVNPYSSGMISPECIKN